MSTGEVIHESETGGRKAGNLEQYDQIPPKQLMEIAAFYTTPYASHWIGQGGSFNELNLQLWKFWGGDDVDPETGYNRLIHIAFQAMELLGVALDEQNTEEYVQLPGRADTWLWFDLLDGEVLRLLARHYGRGAQKYGANNYQKGFDWALSYAALNRHLWQHQSGQFLDEETGSPHLVAVVWHAITLLWFYENKPEFDTRTSTKQKKVEEPWVIGDPAAPWVAGFQKMTEELTKGTGIPAQIDEILAPLYSDVWMSAGLFAQPEKPQCPVYYISGPMTGLPEHNFPAFHAAAEFYRAQGFTVINPAELPGEGDEHPWEWFLRRDLVAMLEGGADTIVLLPGWGTSRGAQLEYHVAAKLGFKVIFHGLQLDTQRNDSWVDALNDIVVDLDDTEGAA